MSSWSPPQTAKVGEPIDLKVEFCSPPNTATEHDVYLEGTPITSESVSDFADFEICTSGLIGDFHTLDDRESFESDPLVTDSNGNLIVTEVGRYTLSIDDPQLNDTHSLLVESAPNPGISLSLKNGIDGSFCGGETAEAVFEATSKGDYVDGSGTVVSNNLITGSSSSQNVTVGYNQTKDVTASVDIPEDAAGQGIDIISVEVQ